MQKSYLKTPQAVKQFILQNPENCVNINKIDNGYQIEVYSDFEKERFANNLLMNARSNCMQVKGTQFPNLLRKARAMTGRSFYV